MEAAECLSFGAHRVGRNQGSTCFWGDQCSAESNCKTQTCDNTWGVGTMWLGFNRDTWRAELQMRKKASRESWCCDLNVQIKSSKVLVC